MSICDAMTALWYCCRVIWKTGNWMRYLNRRSRLQTDTAAGGGVASSSETERRHPIYKLNPCCHPSIPPSIQCWSASQLHISLRRGYANHRSFVTLLTSLNHTINVTMGSLMMSDNTNEYLYSRPFVLSRCKSQVTIETWRNNNLVPTKKDPPQCSYKYPIDTLSYL